MGDLVQMNLQSPKNGTFGGDGKPFQTYGCVLQCRILPNGHSIQIIMQKHIINHVFWGSAIFRPPHTRYHNQSFQVWPHNAYITSAGFNEQK